MAQPGVRGVGIPLSLAARTAALLGLACALAGMGFLSLRTTYDLKHFLPEPATSAQRLLLERLGSGAGSQAIYIVLPSASGEPAGRVAARIRALPMVTRVFPEALDVGIDAIPGALWRHRALLADLPREESAWQAVLEARLADALLADDDGVYDLVAADPLFASIGPILDAAGAWAVAEGTSEAPSERVLMVLNEASSFDIGAQSALVDSLRAALASAGHRNAELYGSGVYGVQLQALVRREATLFSVLACVALLLVLSCRFRSASVVAAIGAPMVVGATAGLAVVAALFEEVHGIALAFGFTLLGVTLDYPLHVFSRRRTQGVVGAPKTALWPTLRIGIATTLIAYGAFWIGGAAGLRQLAVFAMVGIVSAACAAAWIDVRVSDTQPGGRGRDLSGTRFAWTKPVRSKGNHLAHWPWLVTLLVAVPMLLFRTPFTDDIAALTPIPEETLAKDAELRRRLGTAEMRHLVAVHGNGLQAVLERTETVSQRLKSAASAGAVAGHTSVVALLPSAETQRRRRSALQAFVAGGATKSGPFADAAAAVGFGEGVFVPFDAHVAAVARSDTLLTRDELLRDAALADVVAAHLIAWDSPEPVGEPTAGSWGNIPDGASAGAGGAPTGSVTHASSRWTSLVLLRGIDDLDGIARHLKGLDGVELVDLKHAAESLVRDFRGRLLGAFLVALLVVMPLLLLMTRDLERVLWLLGTVSAGVALSAGIGAWALAGLSLFDLMALALVAGLGLDYALFHSKAETDQDDWTVTRRAVAICALSSFVVFAILSFSSVPVLRGIGTVVALGVAATWLLARLGAYPRPAT